MFTSCSLSARIDRAEARLTAAVVGGVIARSPDARAFVEPIAGGVAAYAGPSSPMSKAIGLGYEGAPPAARLHEIEARFRDRGAPLQMEISTLADPSVAQLLTRQGYVLTNFENVSGRVLSTTDGAPSPPSSVHVDLMSDADAEPWIDAAITAFQHPDERGVPSEALPPRDVLDAALRPWAASPGLRRYGAWIDGHLAGVASLRLDDGIAQLCGAGTLPAFRRRGVQAALLARRLADSAAEGCDLAVVTTQPGSTSQENVHRRGFSLLFARAVLVKDLAEG